MAIRVVYPDASQLPAGVSSANLGTEAAPWLGWASIVWGGAGFKGGDTLSIRGNWLSAAVMSVGNHGATVGNPAVIVIEKDTVIDFVNKSHYLWNTRANTVITGTGRIMQIIAQTGADNCEYGGKRVGGKLRGMGSGASVFRFGNNNGGTHRNIVVSGWEITSNATPIASAIVGAVAWWVDNATGAAIENVLVENITANGFHSSRGVVYFQHHPSATFPLTRVKDLVIRDIEANDCKGLTVDVEASGPDGGVDATIKGTIDWSSGIKVQRITTRRNDIAGANFGGGVFVGGFGVSATPGFGPNLIEDIVGENIKGNAGLVDLLFGTYQIRRLKVDGLTPVTIDGCALLLDIGCHNCKAYGIEARRLTGLPGSSYAGSVVLVLGAVNNCEVSGVVADDVASVLGAYDTTTGRNVTVSHVTATNVKKFGVKIDVNVAEPNGIRLLNSVISGSGVSVSNNNAKPWVQEDSNYFNTTGAAVGHAFGANSKNGVDPRINPNTKRPLANSPLIGKARYAGEMRDFTGRKFKAKATIGAFEDDTVKPRVLRTVRRARV